ncbi:hypothetical protein HK097_010096 [Rhizophlyctis rosea]|uniref:Uncharacterized protein n=1 Tax=Rhizophlyctis rosea TaxID=64517 RepID=A0AAD5X8X6_9FUNG|nr:hypothetical protein HK097_010096 [Rhizophlyctis rosea]
MWDSGWRANVPEEQGWKGYILQCAAEADNMAAMRLLVDAGAPLKSTYPEDFNIIACHVRPSADISDRKQCNVETLTEMVTYLLAKGYRITDEDLAAVIDECDVETIRYILRFMDAADESLKGSATWTSLAAAIAADKMPADLVGTVFRKGPAHIWNIWTAYRMIEPAIAVNNAATLDIVKAVVEPLVEREPYESTIGFNGQWKCSPPIFYNVLQAGMWDVAEYLVESGGKEEFMGMVLPELRQEVGPNGGGGVKDLLMGIGADEFVRRIEVVEQKRKDPDWRNNGDAWF